MFGEKSNKQGGSIDTSKLQGIKEALDAGEAVDVTKAFKKANDTAKESYILCDHCEHKRLGISLETYINDFFYRRYRKLYHTADYPVLKRGIPNPGALDEMVCRGVDAGMFKLFIYSLVWRASICSLLGFREFKLDPTTQETLREILNTCLQDTAPETALAYKTNSHLFQQFQFTIFTSLDIPLATNNFASNPFVDDKRGDCYFFINEFIIKFYTQWDERRKYKPELNSGSNPIILVVLNEKRWTNFAMAFVHNVLNNIFGPPMPSTDDYFWLN
jgi:hypothetical protein